MSFYNAPAGMRYTDMCIWVDNNAYKKDCDQVTLFKYIYVCVSMYAHKNKYPYFGDDMESFCCFVATEIFMRYKNKKQFDVDDDIPKLAKIKSLSNYINKTLCFYKITYNKQYFSTCGEKGKDDVDDDLMQLDTVGMLERIDQTVDALETVDFQAYLRDIPQTVYLFIQTLPHKDDIELENIYISCMLTFLNSITLDKKSFKQAKNLIDNYNDQEDEIISNLYKLQNVDPVKLYHLDDSMHDYILVITNRIKQIIARDLTVVDCKVTAGMTQEELIKDYLYSDEDISEHTQD